MIVNGRLFAINLCGKGVTEQEQVFALDVATGKDLWDYKFKWTSIPMCPIAASGASLAVDPETGNVYANGVQGVVFCLDRDGNFLWSQVH